MPATTKQTIVNIISILFIFLFVYAAVSKMIDFQKFRTQLSQSPMISQFTSWIAWLVPAVELILSLLLIIPKTQMESLYGSFSLMVIFSIYIIAITHYSEFIPCSCGGVLEHLSWNAHLLFNIAFIALSVVAILIKPKIVKQS